MAKRRLNIHVTPEADLLLCKAVKNGAASKASLVDAAIKELLDKSRDERAIEKIEARLNKLARAMERLTDDASAQSESLALYILYYLCITPPLPEERRAGAEALGRKRFDHFVSEVGARLLGKQRFADALLATIDLERAGAGGVQPTASDSHRADADSDREAAA